MGRITEMEDHFSCGFKTKPLIHIGSQNLRFWNGSAQEQAHEGFHLVAAIDGDLGVARNIDPEYIKYWESLTENQGIINILDPSPIEYLSRTLLHNPHHLKLIQSKISSDFHLLPFIITHMEQNLIDKLGIKLLGNVNISDTYGTKNGIRELADSKNIKMPPGFVCNTKKEILEAISTLSQNYDKVIGKHSHSASGYLSKYTSTRVKLDIDKFLEEMCGHPYHDGITVVVEAWIKNKSALCSQIEITEDHEIKICAGWQQIMDADGITYIGAGPLHLSQKAFDSFLAESQAIGEFLRDAGAVGVFGPDFLVTTGEDPEFEEDTCLLLELNARAPVTAYPLQAIKCIKGKIGSGFCSTSIKMSKPSTFKEISEILDNKNLLIKQKDTNATGVVVFNPTMIPYSKFDIVTMANSFDETMNIVKTVKDIFET